MQRTYAMSATAFAPRSTERATPGLSLTTQVAGQAELLPAAALALLVSLHRAIEPGRQQRLAQRRVRQAEFDAGQLPDFRPDTRAIRAGDWRVAALPAALQDRRVEITGPTDPKMVINALNSGAKVFMADFEDSTAPTWRNLLAGQRTLAAAVRGDLSFDAPNGKHYTLRPEAERAVLIVRPRGWHLDEKHAPSMVSRWPAACSMPPCSPTTTAVRCWPRTAARICICPSCRAWKKPRCGRPRWRISKRCSACRMGRSR